MMACVKEYIGCKSIEAMNYDGNGHDLCNMWLTEEEVTRCRDCKHYQLCDEGFPICNRGWIVAANDQGCEHELRVEVGPIGYCAWAERDE